MVDWTEDPVVNYVDGTVSLEPAVCVGDVDGNGAVNKSDLSALVFYLIDNASAPFWTVPCP
ncbi:hypothetical protein ES708_29042 [subsurface metagenome]